MMEELEDLFTGSRYPGMPGNKALADHVARAFEASGLTNGVLTFTSPVFDPGPTSVTLADGRVVELLPMHPTLLRPGNFRESKFDAPLVYLGQGRHDDLARLKGTALEGSLAVMDMSSGDRWMSLLRFGFCGFVFIGDEGVEYQDAVSKVYTTEVAVPRFYVPRASAGELREAAVRGETGTVDAEPSRMRVETLHDYWVLIPGSDTNMVKSAYVYMAALDANSIVPQLAKGAQRSVNPYLLLKLLEDLKAEPADRTVLLVAVNGHTQKYLGERIFTWHVLAGLSNVAVTREEMVKEIRKAELFSRNYGLLAFEPATVNRIELDTGMGLLKVLYAQQQTQREDARIERIRQRNEKIAQLEDAGEDATNVRATPVPPIDPVLDLREFEAADFHAALSTFSANLKKGDKETLRRILAGQDNPDEQLRAIAVRADELLAGDAAGVAALVASVKSVFDDEELFENWRDRLDRTTGVSLQIKQLLQLEAKRHLNKLKQGVMDLAVSTELSAEEKQEQIDALNARKDDMTTVLVLFNKIDFGRGRSRVYYRQIALNPTQRALLKGYRDRVLAQQDDWRTSIQAGLDRDNTNDELLAVIEGISPKLIVSLEIDAHADQFSLCAFADGRPGVWPKVVARAAAEVAAELPVPAGETPYFIDTIVETGGRPAQYFFNDWSMGAQYLPASSARCPLSLRSAFSSYGQLFGPDDTFSHFDPEQVYQRHLWLREYLYALANSNVLKTAFVKYDATFALGDSIGGSWSINMRTYALDEFSGSAIPDRAIPNSLVALYRIESKHWFEPPIIGGDVINAYTAQTDASGQAMFYGLSAGALHAVAYQLGPEAREVVHTIDKGQIITSEQIKLDFTGRDKRLTLPMFPCREFPIYDRVDPTLIANSPVTVQQVWPKTAVGKAFPRKYGLHGVAGLPPIKFHKSRGPAAVYAWRRSARYSAERLLVLTDEKRCALNATPEDPEGEGFETAEDLGSDFFAHVPRDMSQMVRHRMTKMKGVANELVDDFLRAGDVSLAEMDAAREIQDQVAYVRAAYQALGTTVKAYEQVRSINGDMLKAIVVYMALMIPFCFFLQKLIFHFTRLEHEMLTFVVFFVLTYVVFRKIHPAFAMAMNPEAIFIAFLLGAIGCFIIWILHTRFEGEMNLLFRSNTGLDDALGTAAVGQQALLIGVNNMKRRRIRTSLTTATIVLVIFTMLAFSSVSRKMQPTLITQQTDAPYTGFFFHWPGGDPMDEETLWSLQNLFEDRARVIVRRILVPRNDRPPFARIKYEFRVQNVASQKTADMSAAVGLSMADEEFLGAFPLIDGKYFSASDAREVILPAAAAEALGFRAEQLGQATLTFMGETLTLVGIVDDTRFRLKRDLNPNLSLVPREGMTSVPQGIVDAGQVEAEASSAATIDTARLMLLPEQRAKRMTARPFTVSIVFPESLTQKSDAALWEEVIAFLSVTRAKFYLGSTEPFLAGAEATQSTHAGTYYVGGGFRTSIGGLSRLLIPLLIAGSIILNTMLGTVYERKSEIAVFNAIGLNPTHIFLFFLAEAFVYSVIGSVGGYLIGQTLTIVIQHFDLIEGLNVNFSSLMVVYAILFTIGLVLVSTLYPGYVATRTAVPSGKRKWALPEHDGTTMHVAFPFIYQPGLVSGVMYYLYEYFAGHTEKSVGDLIATPMGHSREEHDDGVTYLLRYNTALAPFDLGVTQDVCFAAEFDEAVQSYRIIMTNTRVSGQDRNWITTNQPYLNSLRQLLMQWRNIDTAQHNWYVKKGDELFEDPQNT